MKRIDLYNKDRQNNIFIMSIAVVLIIFSGVFFLIYSIFNNDENKEIVNETVMIMEEQNENINNVFKRAVKLSAYLAEDSEIKKIIKNADKVEDLPESGNYDEVMNRLINILDLDENIYLSWFMSVKNYFLASDYTTSDEYYDYRVRPWFKTIEETPEKKTVFSKPYYEYNTGTLAISCMTGIYDEDKLAGYASVDISLEKLPEIMEQYITGEKGKNYLISDTGTIIITSEKPGNRKLISYSLIKPHVEELKETGGKYKIINIYGKKYIVTYSSIKSNDWQLVQIADMQEMREHFNETIRKVLIVFFFGILAALLILFENIRRNFRISLHFKNQAETDYLTGIGNRRIFFEEGKKRYYLASAERIGTSLLMADIDKFKQINDVYGHEVGDEAIKKVADTLKNNIRGGDVLCRYGGDEFSLVLYNVSKELAGEIAERIIKEIREIDIEIGGKKIPLSITVGISVAGANDNYLFEEMVKRADDALISAKEKGIKIEFFDKQAGR